MGQRANRVLCRITAALLRAGRSHRSYNDHDYSTDIVRVNSRSAEPAPDGKAGGWTWPHAIIFPFQISNRRLNKLKLVNNSSDEASIDPSRLHRQASRD